MKQLLLSIFTILSCLFFPSNVMGQGVATAVEPNFVFEGTIGQGDYRLEIELDLAGSGNFTGRYCGLGDLQQYGDVQEMWKPIKGHFNNNTEEMWFDAYFYGESKPFAKFQGMWGETSDGEGIHGELTTLSIGMVEDVHLYEPE